MPRTHCKYGDCDLEKLEKEFLELKKLWLVLKKNWIKPDDWEDLYRLYPLITTTSALARQRLSDKAPSYNVEIISPKIGDKKRFDDYFYSDADKFFNGKKTCSSLKSVISSFLHAKNYVYMDTRKSVEVDSEYKIYLFVATDYLCLSCNEANIGNPNQRYGKKHVGYTDCICGQYVDLDSFINTVEAFIEAQINKNQ